MGVQRLRAVSCLAGCARLAKKITPVVSLDEAGALHEKMGESGYDFLASPVHVGSLLHCREELEKKEILK